MVRLYDRIRRDGLMDTDNDDLAATALGDLRGPVMPVLVVDNAVDCWFGGKQEHLIATVLPYVPIMFIEARVKPSFKELLPGKNAAPDEFGVIALRTDLWEHAKPGGNGSDPGAATTDLVTQRIADSVNGLFIPIDRRVPIDPVRWMVDLHLIIWNAQDTAKPEGPIVSLTGFLTPAGRFVRAMDGEPLLLSLMRPVERDLELKAMIWVDALLFGVSVGWCQNVAVIETETPPPLRDAFRRRHGFPLCDPLILAPELDALMRADIAANAKPLLSPTRLDLKPGRFDALPDGNLHWTALPPSE